ncbi:MAG: hypothetical protein SO170_06265 [Butyribacter sp.]|nr:hypothetical protein [bacterium]MDY3854537.1 hypothetical protein [Butyribacter sp.]
MDMTVNNNTTTYAATTATSTTKTAQETAAATEEKDAAAVYEKSSTTKKDNANQIYNRESIIKKLKADQESRMQSMQSLVEKLLNKQKGTFDLASSTGLADTFRQASKLASPEDIAQAQKDVADDGYWGVEQTSDRLVSMAIALSGGDTEKADELKEAITKGFKQATSAWGEELPKLCQDTYDAAMKKMDDWKNGVTTAEDYANYLS